MTDSADRPRPRRTLTVVLFVIYAALLVGLVLFKFPFNYLDGGSGRDLNLIPFAGSVTETGTFRWSEVVENVLVFIPFGIYLGMLAPSWSFGRKLIPIVATTVAFEVIQYIFAIGRSDITDVLGNTLGGTLGIGIYAALDRALHARTRRVLNIVLVVTTTITLGFFAVIAVHSARGR